MFSLKKRKKENLDNMAILFALKTKNKKLLLNYIENKKSVKIRKNSNPTPVLHVLFHTMRSSRNNEIFMENIDFLESIIQHLSVDSLFIKDNNNLTLFDYTIKLMDIRFFNQLLKKGINIKKTDEQGRNYFFIAIKNSYGTTLQKKVFIAPLIKRGLDINQKDNNGITPLEYALELKKFDLAEYLIKNNANIENISINKYLEYLNKEEKEKLPYILKCLSLKENINSNVQTKEDKIFKKTKKF